MAQDHRGACGVPDRASAAFGDGAVLQEHAARKAAEAPDKIVLQGGIEHLQRAAIDHGVREPGISPVATVPDRHAAERGLHAGFHLEHGREAAAAERQAAGQGGGVNVHVMDVGNERAAGERNGLSADSRSERDGAAIGDRIPQRTGPRVIGVLHHCFHRMRRLVLREVPSVIDLPQVGVAVVTATIWIVVVLHRIDDWLAVLGNVNGIRRPIAIPSQRSHVQCILATLFIHPTRVQKTCKGEAIEISTTYPVVFGIIIHASHDTVFRHGYRAFLVPLVAVEIIAMLRAA